MQNPAARTERRCLEAVLMCYREFNYVLWWISIAFYDYWRLPLSPLSFSNYPLRWFLQKPITRLATWSPLPKLPLDLILHITVTTPFESGPSLPYTSRHFRAGLTSPVNLPALPATLLSKSARKSSQLHHALQPHITPEIPARVPTQFPSFMTTLTSVAGDQQA